MELSRNRHIVSTSIVVCLVVLSGFDRAHSAAADAGHSDRHSRHSVSFIARSEFPTAPSPASMAIGDFNNDNLLDIASVSNPSSFPSPNPNALTILLGKGNGTFKALPDFPVGTNLGSVVLVAGDFNRLRREKGRRCRWAPRSGCHDGALDLAVANQFDDSVSILTGRGDGTFQPTAVIKVGERPVALVIADFNNDGLTDLGALSSPLLPPVPVPQVEPGSISILLGQGDGAFQSLAPITVGLVPSSLAVGDFNNDGVVDLAVADSNGVSLLIGQGSGAFQVPFVVSSAAASILTVGDFDGNGNADLAGVRASATQTSISILLGHGDGTFQSAASVFLNPSRPSALANGDIDGDDLPDLVITDQFNSTVSVARGFGDGTFAALPSIAVGRFPRALAMGDFNRDGRLDLTTANQGGDSVSILLSRGHGRFEVAPAYSTGACCPSSLVVGDFDGDGHVDLVDSNFPDKTISLLKGLGNRRFQPAASMPAPDFPWEMAAADFDGDGRLDLAITNPGLGGGGNSVSILLGHGDGSFQTAPTVTVGPVPAAVVAADLNSDGRPDLAVTNDFGASVSILLGRGDGTFQAGPTVVVGRNPLAMAAADVNGDSCIDLVVANTNQNNMAQPGSISTLLGRCNGTFQVAPEVTVGERPISVAVGDLNGDGQLDLAVTNQFGNPFMSILLGNGDGTYQGAPDVAVSGEHVVIADFNDDGRQDLAVSNLNANYVTLLLGRGDGTFKVNLLAGVGQAPEFMVQHDFNGDGFPDLATADYESETVSILINRSRAHWFIDDDDLQIYQVDSLRHERRLDDRLPLWRRMGS